MARIFAIGKTSGPYGFAKTIDDHKEIEGVAPLARKEFHKNQNNNDDRKHVVETASVRDAKNDWLIEEAEQSVYLPAEEIATTIPSNPKTSEQPHAQDFKSLTSRMASSRADASSNRAQAFGHTLGRFTFTNERIRAGG